MPHEDLIYRFLKARANINKNADILTTCIEADRSIDAVELDGDGLKNQQLILDSAELSYYMLNINNHIVLLYPSEERDKYMSIKNMLKFHENMAEYTGFSYAEADVIKDLLNHSKVPYQVCAGDDMQITFLIPETSSAIMEHSMNALEHELSTDIGRKYLMAKNICWANTIGNVSKALDFTGVSYIGSEGGTRGIRIDSDGAVVIKQNGKSDFISRLDPAFSIKVINAALYDLNGGITPIKRISGGLAEEITYGMTKENILKKPISKRDAIKKLGLKELPDIKTLAELKEKPLTEEKQLAVYALMRMVICRSMQIEEAKDLKTTKGEREEYLYMHNRLIHEMDQEEELGR